MHVLRSLVRIVAPLGALVLSLAATFATPSDAAPRRPTTASNFIERLDRLVLGRNVQRHVRLNRAERRQVAALHKRLVNSRGRRAARQQFAQLARGRGGRGQTQQLDALAGSVAYAAQSEQIPSLGKLVDGLAATAAKAELARNKLKCKEDDLKSPAGGLARSRVWCTPAVPESAVVGFRDLLQTTKKITLQVQRMEATANQPGAARLKAIAALAGGMKISDLTSEQLMAEFLKLNCADPNNNDSAHDQMNLLLKLAKLQAQYDAAKKKCDAGNASECSKAKDLAAQIAELEAQLAAL